MASPPNPYAHLSPSELAWLTDIHARGRAAIRQALERHGRKTGLGAAVARARVAYFDHEMKQVVDAMDRAKTPVDCRRGCASCCTLKVEITPDEAFALADELATRLDATSLGEARQRAQENDDRGRGLAPAERHLLRMPCPVLDRMSGACRGHAVRPAPCQGYLSLSRLKCETAALGTPTEIPRPAAADLIREAVASAQIIVLREAGLDQSHIELSAGLMAAWSDPGAERRWLAGGVAFPVTGPSE